MRATDVEPNRLVAAQNAAKQFVAEQPENVRIGVVAFAGTATVAQAPTRNRDDIIAAIDRFQLQRATAIGSAIIVSLATIFPNEGIDVGELTYGNPKKGEKPAGSAPKPVPPGSYASAVIILLTDGQRTTGPDSIQAAKMAADRGVRIYTVGVGTPEGKIIGFEGWSMRVRLDEESLKAIADLTRAEYFYAGSATELKKVYQLLRSKLVLEKKQVEVTALFSAIGAATVLLSATLSLLWFNRIL
jgi:Ca-activated chloride channel family protein